MYTLQLTKNEARLLLATSAIGHAIIGGNDKDSYYTQSLAQARVDAVAARDADESLVAKLADLEDAAFE